MNQTTDNHPQTPADPVKEVMPEVIQCFVDWLEVECKSDQKAYRILKALGQESLKKKTYPQDNRRFTAKEIAVSAGESEDIDATRWIDWKKTVEKYWNARKNGLIDLAMKRGLKYYPMIHRNSTPGGPGNEATYEIIAESMPENETKSENIAEPILGIGEKSKSESSEKSNEALETIQYSRSNPSEVKLSWWARIIFRKGEFKLDRWKFWLMLFWVLVLIMVPLFFVYLGFFSLIAPKPITTQVLSILIMMIVIPLWAWYDGVKPLTILFDDRIKKLSDSMLAFKEKDAQMEVYREGDIRVIRIVRYSSACSICGSDVYLDDGSPDFPRRMVGRCAESPREHIFSFDRVTRKGAVLRSPPL